jgi:BCCT family betaine/carnitine transporter
MVFILFVGPTGDILNTAATGAVGYIKNLIPLSMPFGREDVNFSQGWTSFYWAWWISWSPFVGMFIARVSRGRTVREFLLCVILVPTVLCVLWMATFGGTALSQVIADASAPVGAVAQEIKLFHMLSDFPLSGLLSLIGIVLVLVFFVPSSDSGSLVIDTITAGGKTDAPVSQRVFWCSLFPGSTVTSSSLKGFTLAIFCDNAWSIAINTGH